MRTLFSLVMVLFVPLAFANNTAAFSSEAISPVAASNLYSCQLYDYPSDGQGGFSMGAPLGPRVEVKPGEIQTLGNFPSHNISNPARLTWDVSREIPGRVSVTTLKSGDETINMTEVEEGQTARLANLIHHERLVICEPVKNVLKKFMPMQNFKMLHRKGVFQGEIYQEMERVRRLMESTSLEELIRALEQSRAEARKCY